MLNLPPHLKSSTPPDQRPEPLSEIEMQNKVQALISYALMSFGLLTGLFWFVGGFWAMFKRRDAEGGRFYSHFNNAVGVFWGGLLWMLAGLIFSATFFGFIIWMIGFLWILYRLVKGFALITSDRPY